MVGEAAEKPAEDNCFAAFDASIPAHAYAEAVAVQITEGFQRDPHMAQLILSAHNTRLLSETLYRRDQIWFTEMKQDRTEQRIYIRLQK